MGIGGIPTARRAGRGYHPAEHRGDRRERAVRAV